MCALRIGTRAGAVIGGYGTRVFLLSPWSGVKQKAASHSSKNGLNFHHFATYFVVTSPLRHRLLAHCVLEGVFHSGPYEMRTGLF